MKASKNKKSKKPLLFSMVDKAPFSGKYPIRDAYVEFASADDSLKRKRALGLAGILGTMVALHAGQAVIGSDALKKHAEMAASGDNASMALMILDATYVFTNAAVTARQSALIGRVHGEYKDSKYTEGADTESPGANKRPERQHHSAGYLERLGATAFTLAGQGAAIVSWRHANGLPGPFL